MTDKRFGTGGDAFPEPQYDNGNGSDRGVNPIASARASRRQFIKGVIASGAAVSGAGVLFGSLSACAPNQQVAAGGVERMLRLMINGVERTVDVLPNETLAMTLRYKLNLTGTKLGCDRGECGACTVLVDDITFYSCSTLTHAMRGKSITTIEGVASSDGELHPVQQAMIDELGPQCGFCTPGQVMSAVALLKTNPKPTRDEARLALSGNLCRCGAYDHYLNSVMRAAEMA
jgi:aerobic-type carbon monoxide dehydrogenase small subunit (CoxS/CutS family)